MADDFEFATLRASEERLAFLLKLSDALRPLGDPLDRQEVAARLLGEHLQVNRVGYAEIEDNKYVIRREYARGVASLTGQGPAGSFGAALSEAYRRGETVVVSDVGTDPRFTESERVVMRERQIAAFAGVMLLKGGRLVAAFGANNATARQWTPMEVELVRDVAERTWEAVEQARAEAMVRGNEERLAFLLRLNDALRPLSDPGERPGDRRPAPGRAPRRRPASATRSSRAASTSSVANYTRGVAPLRGDRPVREHSERDCARRTGAARRSW